MSVSPITTPTVAFNRPLFNSRITYSSQQLTSVCSNSFRPSRALRKILFRFQIWCPADCRQERLKRLDRLDQSSSLLTSLSITSTPATTSPASLLIDASLS